MGIGLPIDVLLVIDNAPTHPGLLVTQGDGKCGQYSQELSQEVVLLVVWRIQVDVQVTSPVPEEESVASSLGPGEEDSPPKIGKLPSCGLEGEGGEGLVEGGSNALPNPKNDSRRPCFGPACSKPSCFEWL